METLTGASFPVGRQTAKTPFLEGDGGNRAREGGLVFCNLEGVWVGCALNGWGALGEPSQELKDVSVEP